MKTKALHPDLLHPFFSFLFVTLTVIVVVVVVVILGCRHTAACQRALFLTAVTFRADEPKKRKKERSRTLPLALGVFLWCVGPQRGFLLINS